MNDDLNKELQIGYARLREFWLNQAETSFRRVLAAEPDQPAALHLLGVTTCKLGRNEEGIALIRRAIEIQPERSAARSDLAVALRNTTPQGSDAAYSVDRAEHKFKLIDYQYCAQIRYGAGRVPHPQLSGIMDEGRARYAAFIEQAAPFHADFAAIALDGDYAGLAPFWHNTWFPPLDGMALHTILCDSNPALFIEIGSGISTKFARRAIAGHGLRTRVISIDPQPRNQIDRLADHNIRAPLESVDQQIFDELGENDILFLDSSHRAFQNSDVTTFFLEVLPRLKPGVIVHLHDIYLPYDYPSGHLWRLWNEQYLLATALLYGGKTLEILFPCWYVSQDPELSALTNASLRKGALAGLSVHGASFWMRKA